MPSFSERLKAKNKLLADKQKQLDTLHKSIETAKAEIKTVNREIEEISEVISTLEARILADTLRERGITVAQITKAIEVGAFAPNFDTTNINTDDKSEGEKVDTYINSDGKPAENGETTNDKEEKTDEISSS